MSAFMVNNQTMQRCVAGLAMVEASIGGLDARFAGGEIGRILFDLNADAVNDRYRDAADRAKAPAYRHAKVNDRPMELFKALDCLLYQCAEGDIPKRPEFHDLEHAAGLLAMYLARRTDDYERASWGGAI